MGWNICRVSKTNFKTHTHTQPTFVFLQGLITIHLSVTEQPHWSTASFLPSLGLFFRPHAGLTLFFFFFCLVQFSLEQNRLPPAASCSRTQHFVPPSSSWWRRAGPPCCHSAASVYLSGSTWGWEEAFEQLCASRSSFLGLQRRPAVKKWQNTVIRDAWQAGGCHVWFRSGWTLRGSSVTDGVTKHNELWIWAWALVILEDGCDKAQRAPCCCHLLPSILLAWQELCLHKKHHDSSAYHSMLTQHWHHVRHNAFLHECQRANNLTLSRCARDYEFLFFFYACRTRVRQNWLEITTQGKSNKAIKTEVVSLSIQVLPLSLIWVDLWQGHGNPLLSISWN